MSEQVRRLAGNRFRVQSGGRQRLAWAIAAPAGTWVFLDGDIHLVADNDTTAGRTRAPQREDAAALSAPMPARVVTVHVEPGAEVRQGDVLILLEAMKMELAVRAPRDGRVRRVACRPGELVQAGVALLELD